MTTFLRLLNSDDKEKDLLTAVHSPQVWLFNVEPAAFRQIPGAPFAYWVSENVRGTFARMPAFETSKRHARAGLTTNSDFRFLRLWWEGHERDVAPPFAKGGAFSPYYSDVFLVIRWGNGDELKAFALSTPGTTHWSRNIRSPEFYFRPGITWPLRTTSQLSVRAMPTGCIFGHKGPAAFAAGDSPEELLALLALTNSHPFIVLVQLQLAAADAAARSYEVGVIQKTPTPALTAEQGHELAACAHHAWSLTRALDTVVETSHAFVLPDALRGRTGDYDSSKIEAELVRVQSNVNGIASALYGFSAADGLTLEQGEAAVRLEEVQEEEDLDNPLPSEDAVLSWAIGVAFGRFDWRLATGERKLPSGPEPFDVLPAKSPGMLPDDAEPFHSSAGILVDDPGHPHDIARIIEEVLDRVQVPVPSDVRAWIQRECFALHLQRYSKSRRKAPIYWPISTTSGVYTLWLYYPSLTSQTLYIAVNDFVEPKMARVATEAEALREKGATRSRADEKRFEALQTLESELVELRDALLTIAPQYQLSHADGVQITASPLWRLFRHKPWQKLLKETWSKLERGDYDWAQLAMRYWPERVREKCTTDKSLAIAHGLIDLFVERQVNPKKTRGKRTSEDQE